MENIHDLLISAKSGDDYAFSQLFKITINNLHYYARTLTSNEAVIDDVLQEAYIKGFQKINDLKDDNFIAWMHRIIINTFHDYNKSSYVKHNTNESGLNFVGLEDDVIFEMVDESEKYRPDIASSKETLKRIVFNVLDSLPEDQRVVINLCFFEGYKQKEAADIIGINLNTLKSRLNYGMRKIKEIMTEIETREGVRYHNIAPLPLFIWLYKQFMGQIELVSYTEVASAAATVGSVVTESSKAANEVTAKVTKDLAKHNVANVTKSATKAIAGSSLKTASTSVIAKIGVSAAVLVGGGTVAYQTGILDPIIDPILNKSDNSTVIIETSSPSIESDGNTLEQTENQVIETPTSTESSTIMEDNPYNPFDTLPYMDVDIFEGHEFHFVKDSKGVIHPELSLPGETYTPQQVEAIRRCHVFDIWRDDLFLKYDFAYGVGGDFGFYYCPFENAPFMVFTISNEFPYERIYNAEMPVISQEYDDGEHNFALGLFEDYNNFNRDFSPTYDFNQKFFPIFGCEITSGQSEGGLKEGDEVTIECNTAPMYQKYVNVNIHGKKTLVVSNVKNSSEVYEQYPDQYGYTSY